MKRFCLFLFITFLLTTANCLYAQEQKRAFIEEVLTVTSEVVGIEKNNRKLTLKKENGEIITITVVEAARNFNQLRIGDNISVTYYESLVVYLGEHGIQPEENTTVVATRTPKGYIPGGTIVGTVDVSAKVVGVNIDKRTLSLELPEGNVITTKVAEDVKKLEELKLGDTIHVRLTNALAVSVSRN